MPETPLSERRQKAFEYAAESVKQLLTLASVVIAFTVTFSKDFISGVTDDVRWLAALSWLFFLLSAVSGVWALQTLAGQMDQTPKDDLPGDKEDEWPRPTIWATPVKWTWITQQVTFAGGLVFAVIFGFCSLMRTPANKAYTPTVSQTNYVVAPAAVTPVSPPDLGGVKPDSIQSQQSNVIRPAAPDTGSEQ